MPLAFNLALGAPGYHAMTDIPNPTFASKRKALKSQVLQQIDMFDHLPDPLLQLTGRKGVIKWANKAAFDLLGTEIIDHKFNHLFVSKSFKTALMGLRKREDQKIELMVRPKNLDGREFRVRLVRLEKKSPYGARVLVTLSDVSEVLRLQAQRANFVANASHELKTPITALSGFIETLEQDPKALKTFLPQMVKVTKRMRELINNLLDLAKTEMQADTYTGELVDILTLIDHSIDGLSPEFERRAQKLKIFASETRIEAYGNATALTTVFTNLLQNASKYSQDHCVIRIKAKTHDKVVRIDIEDEGKGIAAEHIPRLTERFYRIDDSRDQKQGGTGLGLAIVKHILLRHEGKLQIQSIPGKGSCFTVILPSKKREDGAE